VTTLAANKARRYEVSPDPLFTDIPVIAADIIYEGAAVGESASSGTARPLVDGDTFLGFAVAKADNSAGAASAINVRTAQRGLVLLTLAAAAEADLGAAVYATDDDTFSLTDSGSDTQIGVLTRFVSATTAIVHFEATALRSI